MSPKAFAEMAKTYYGSILVHQVLWDRLGDSFDKLIERKKDEDNPGFWNDIRRHELNEHQSNLKVELEEAAEKCAVQHLLVEKFLLKGDDEQTLKALLGLAEAYGRFAYFEYFLQLEATTRTKRKTQSQNAAKPFVEKMQAKVCALLTETPQAKFEGLKTSSSFPMKAVQSLEEALAAYADTLKPNGGDQLREDGPSLIRQWMKGNKGFQEKVQAIVATKILPAQPSNV